MLGVAKSVGLFWGDWHLLAFVDNFQQMLGVAKGANHFWGGWHLLPFVDNC